MKIVLAFIGVIILLLYDLKAQNCGSDSVVTTYLKDLNDANGATNRIVVDSFDVANGHCVSCTRESVDSFMGPYICGLKLFSRRYFELNAYGDTLQYFLFDGTGSGYTNNRRIEYTYDIITNKKLSRHEFTGNGGTWIPFSKETWNYNSQNLLLSYEKLISDGSGGLENSERSVYYYSSNLLDSVYVQLGQNLLWNDYRKYLYTYSGTVRDSFLIQYWNTATVDWEDIYNLKYDYPQQTATYAHSSYDSFGYLIDSNSVMFDFWNNIIDSYSYIIDQQSGFVEYKYHHTYALVGNNFLKETLNFSNDNGCVISKSTQYDSHGVKSGAAGFSHCFMPTSNSSYVLYDSNYRTQRHHFEYSSNVNNVYRDSIYYYHSPSSIHLGYVKFTDMGVSICKGDTIQPAVLVSGGCGAYRFSWSPSNNLSSDTIAEPFIIVDDSVLYTITVTDSLGNMATAFLMVVPTEYVEITYDTTSCIGCPVMLYTSYSSSNNFTWYRDGVVIPGAHADSLLVDSSGSYYVEIYGPFLNCHLISNPVNIIISNPTSLQESNLEEIMAFPVPADNYVMLTGINENSEYYFIDSYGRRILQGSISNSDRGEFYFSVRDFPSGVYTLVISKNGYKKRLVVVH